MKKVVFVTRRMVMGGIEKALISMIESMSKEEFDITVLVMGKGGELLKEIPQHVEVQCLYGNENSTIEKIWNCIKKVKLIRAFKIGYYTILSKRAKSIFQQEMYHSKMLPALDTEYDFAIAYQVPASFPVVYVIDHIIAKTKVAWIHSDVSWYKKELEPYNKFYQKYDKIFCVSKQALNKFVDLYPMLKDKTYFFNNIINSGKVESMSVKDRGFNDGFEGVRILTVGRLTSEKGQDIIPSLLRELISEGLDVRWYCIGEGDQRPKIEGMIKQYNLEEHLILLGTKSNPYPYMKQCDIYVQTSRHEGYCIALAEARIFNKPIITTDSAGGKEQVLDGVTGYIVNELEITNKVKELIQNKKTREKFRENLKRLNVSASSQMEKMKELLKA